MSDGKTYSGSLSADGLRFALVATRFNTFVVSHLVDGAKDRLVRLGADASAIDVATVPGAFEIPLAAQKLAASGQYDAVVCLGAVIRGDTPHFDYVAGEAARGVGRASMDTGVPITFGVLTCDTVEQAIQRAGVKGGNKGGEAAEAAVEMATLMRTLP